MGCLRSGLITANDSRIRRVWCIGEERAVLAKRKAFEAPLFGLCPVGEKAVNDIKSGKAQREWMEQDGVSKVTATVQVIKPKNR